MGRDGAVERRQGVVVGWDGAVERRTGLVVGRGGAVVGVQSLAGLAPECGEETWCRLGQYRLRTVWTLGAA